jgi:hypothetical protein
MAAQRSGFFALLQSRWAGPPPLIIPGSAGPCCAAAGSASNKVAHRDIVRVANLFMEFSFYRFLKEAG